MDLIFLSAIIGFLALDTTVAFQMLLSSPLFACPILGWILGDIQTGFELGFLLQLLWLGRIPAGAVVFPEGNIASMVITSLVLLNKGIDFPNSTLAFAFLEGIIVSYLGAQITLIYRKINGKTLNMVIKQVENKNFKIILLLEAGSIILYFLIMFVFTWMVLLISQQILPIFIPKIGGFFEHQLIVVKPAILGIGLAMAFPLIKDALSMNQDKKNDRTY